MPSVSTVAALIAALATHAAPPKAAPAAPPPRRVSAANSQNGFLLAPYFGATSFYAVAAQSGQKWLNPHPWTWRAPGIDFAIGVPNGTALKDPATAGLPPPCVYQPTGSRLGGPRVYCARPNNLAFTAFDMSRHGCVPLVIANATGTLTISNSQFLGGPNCSVTKGALIWISGGAPTIVLDHDLLDEQYVAGSGAPALAATVFTNTTGPITVSRTAILNASARPLSGATLGPILIEDSLFYGFVLATANPTSGEHGEIYELGSPVIGGNFISVDYENNVVVIPSATGAAVTTPFYADGTPGHSQTIGTFKVNHNIIVVNASINGYRGKYYTTAHALFGAGWQLSIATVELTNNFVDASGALDCGRNLGGPITKLVETANVSLVTGAAITGIGGAGPGATCPPRF